MNATQQVGLIGLMAAIAVVLFGLALSNAVPGGNDGPGHPPLIAVNGTGAQTTLVHLRYSPEEESYLTAHTENIGPIDTLAAGDETVSFTRRDTLYRYDLDTGRRQARIVGDIQSIAVDGRQTYVAADGRFHVYGPDLEEQGSITIFNRSVGNKNVHGIDIHGDTAYLVDNIMFPKYLFRINISDPSSLSRDRTTVYGINQQLGQQWFDPARDRWYVIQSSGTMAGSFQDVLTFSMETGEQKRSYQVYSSSRLRSNTTGRRIQHITDRPPFWAITTRNSTSHLARVTFNDTIKFDHHRTIDGSITSLQGHNGTAFLIIDGQLQLIGPGDQTLHRQRLGTAISRIVVLDRHPPEPV
jgi:hypothetical protein